MTARALQGMAPYPGQARCLALGFGPECFRRLDVKGGRRPFPEETRSALDIEGKHGIIQGPSPDLSPVGTVAPSPYADRPYLLSLDYQLGKLCGPGCYVGLTCDVGCPRVTVRDPSLPVLMAR